MQVTLAQAGRLPLCEGGPLDDKKQEGNIATVMVYCVCLYKLLVKVAHLLQYLICYCAIGMNIFTLCTIRGIIVLCVALMHNM